MKSHPILAVALLILMVLNAKSDFSQVMPADEKTAMTLDPAKLDFPAQAAGTTGPSQTITLSNAGSSTLRVTDILVAGIDFSETNTCQQPLAAGSACNIEVRFKPAVTGLRLGALRITASDGGAVRTVPLTGTGE